MRSLGRGGLFTLTAVLTLALTMAAVTTVFSLAETLLFRPPNVERPRGLVVVAATRAPGRGAGFVSHPDYVRFRDESRTLEALAAHYSTSPLWVSAGNESREVNGAVVSANFFPLLGVRPARGRFLNEEEDRVPDRDRVVVLGHELWRDWFSSSEEVVGRSLRINATPFTVIGVAPPGFRGLTPYPNAIYLPTMMLRVGYRWCDGFRDDCTVLSMIGRLAEGHTVAQATAEMTSRLPPAWRTAAGDRNTGVTVFTPRGADLRAEREDEESVTLLGLVAGLLLLVCCANLAGLLMARSAARTRDLAIRASLGAGRVRLLRQLMTESVLLALGGGALGMGLSLALTRVLAAGFYCTGGAVYDFRLQPSVALLVLGVSLAASWLFGLLPAWKSIAASSAESLRRQASSVSARSAWARPLLAAQAAAATALLVVAGLLGVSAHRLAQGTNFEPAQVALFRLRPRLVGYPAEKAQAYHGEVIRRLSALPGVSSVSVVGTGAALTGGDTTVALPERTADQGGGLPAGFMEVGPRYFETLRTPLLEGREFNPHDGLASPAVAVVNQRLASRLWPAGNALSQTLLVDGRPHRVVGIAADVSLEDRTKAPRPYVYVPFAQNAGAIDARYCVRVDGDPAARLRELVRVTNEVDPDVPVTEARTLEAQMADGVLRPARLMGAILIYAAGLAVLLCALGLYGTLAFSVARRTKEIGIRMAVGATHGRPWPWSSAKEWPSP